MGPRVALVDLSTAGVAVVSVQILKPNQSGRILVEKGGDAHRGRRARWPGPVRILDPSGFPFEPVSRSNGISQSYSPVCYLRPTKSVMAPSPDLHVNPLRPRPHPDRSARLASVSSAPGVSS